MRKTTRLRHEAYNEHEKHESDLLAALFSAMVSAVEKLNAAGGMQVDRFSVVFGTENGVGTAASITGKDGMVEDFSVALARVGYTVVLTSVHEPEAGQTKEH